MARRPGIGPTEAELEILQVLWNRGPSTVRQINRAINGIRKTGYTTTLKLMQIMLGKGLLQRDESQRPQVYEATLSKDKAERRLVGDLLERVFEGSASQFVQQVLAAKNASPEEMSAIRRILRNFGKGKS